MFENLSSSERILAIQRLTALWALNECGLGGILHALQSPFTGLLVGSIAMICIALICAFAEHKWQAVMTSLAIVLVIKALVSPHSTPTAYVAVIFQGVTGAFIYRYVPGLLFGSVLFASLGLIESAVQRLLVLTILYGNSLWEAIDLWGAWVAERWGMVMPLSSSRLIIYVYLLIHLITGIFVGWFIYRTIMSIYRNWGQSHYQLQLGSQDRKSLSLNKNKKKRWKRYLLFGVLVIMIVSAYTLHPQNSDWQKGFIALFRAVSLLMIWFLFLAPLVLKMLKKYLTRKHHELSAQVARTMDIFPELTWIIDKAWKETKHLSWFARWKSFVTLSLLYILQYHSTYDPYPDRTDTKP